MNTITNIETQIVNSFLSIYDKILLWAPRVIGAFIVLLIGVYISDIVKALFNKVFKMVKIETLMNKLGVNQLLKSFGLDIGVVGILSGLVYWLVYLVFISAAASTLGIGVVTEFINKLIGWLPSIFAGLLIMVIGIMAAEALYRALSRVKGGTAYKNIVKWSIIVIAFITALQQIGFNISFITDNLKLIVAGAVLALALAFGLGGKEKAREIVDRYIK